MYGVPDSGAMWNEVGGLRYYRFYQSRYGLLLFVIIVFVTLIAGTGYLLSVHMTQQRQHTPLPPTSQFIASIDTMKVSRDTIHHQLSTGEIKAIINLSTSVHSNYITVDTEWNYATYMQNWINVIRATGKHVWFRIHPDQWENTVSTTGIMTPIAYERSEQQFISSHPSFFHAGDILDPCPEPEQGPYWIATYGLNWTANAPNMATKSYNAFLRTTTDIADQALHHLNIYGVITTIRSTNSFFPAHPGLLESATVKKFGHITIDSYPEQSLQDAGSVVTARIVELNEIENLWHMPIILGEMGYSNALPVDDATQQRVLNAEFNAIVHLNYIIGLNYWVGAGSNTAGGYTYIFKYSSGNWIARPAAWELATFFSSELAKTKRSE
jgi:hypothetical protein